MYESGVESEDVEVIETAVARVCGALDPDSVPQCDVAAVYGSLGRMRKLIVGAETRMARRLEESQAWIGQGDQSAADYIARNSGCSKNAAKEQLSTSERLKGLAETDEAVRNGELSDAQASAISDAAAADPGSQSRLLSASKNKGLGELKDDCRRTKANADPDPEVTYRRLRSQRRLRRWNDGEGAYNLSLRTTPEVGAQFDAELQPVIDRLLGDARRRGDREPIEAYGADALAELVTGWDRPSNETGDSSASDTGHETAAAPTPARRHHRARHSKVIALIDYHALRRGHAEAGETCEIVGVGPVPTSTVQAMLTDAFLSVVVTDGVDVYNVAHLGRQTTAHQRTGLEARGYRCEVPGCDVRHNLEIDHITGWTITRQTKLDDLCWLCHHHHQLKTHSGYQITGKPTNRRWKAPNGTIVAADHDTLFGDGGSPDVRLLLDDDGGGSGSSTGSDEMSDRARPPDRERPPPATASPAEPTLFGPDAA